jgi:TolA-binding protein
MKRSSLTLGLLAIFVLSGCKTTEDIRREQMVDNLSLQMVQNQQMTAEATVRLQALEERLGLLTGQVEEQEYQTIQENQRQLKELGERMNLIETNNRNTQRELEAIKTQLNEQKKFLDELMKTLNTLTQNRQQRGGGATGGTPANLYDEAMEDYTRGRYAQARPKLERLLNENRVRGNQRSRTLHNLGMIAFMDKKDELAQVYFSRLITEHAQAGQVRNGMLFLGKSFQRSGMKTEARQILEELVRQFPDANQVAEARKILSSL